MIVSAVEIIVLVMLTTHITTEDRTSVASNNSRTVASNNTSRTVADINNSRSVVLMKSQIVMSRPGKIELSALVM